jgi:transposase
MKRFVEGADRGQSTLLPECLEDWIDEDNPVRAIDAFVDALDLASLGFDGVEPAATGRPAFHPSVLLKLYIYGYLNRVQSSRRLEREAGRNLELLWLLGRLVPDHKTIADFRKDNGEALRRVCAHFVGLCREIGLLATASVAIDGSKFKAVNNRDKNFTRARWSGGARRWSKALPAISPSSTLPTCRSRRRRSPPRRSISRRNLQSSKARWTSSPRTRGRCPLAVSAEQRQMVPRSEVIRIVAEHLPQVPVWPWAKGIASCWELSFGRGTTRPCGHQLKLASTCCARYDLY